MNIHELNEALSSLLEDLTEEEWCVNLENDEEWFSDEDDMMVYAKDHLDEITDIVHYIYYLDDDGELEGDTSDHTDVVFSKDRQIDKLGLVC